MNQRLCLLVLFWFTACGKYLSAASDGPGLFLQHCAICHGQQGAGVAGIFPPLAGSDFPIKDRSRALRAPMEGLFGKIEVSGVSYTSAMPPVLLNDEDLTAVFNHVFTSWGNSIRPVSAEEIAAARAKSKFASFDALRGSMVGAQLPPPPAGWELKVGAELSFSPVRLVFHPDGQHVLALEQNGNIWSWQPGESLVTLLIEGKSYIDASLGNGLVDGMTVDKQNRLYLVCNQRHEATTPVRNEVTIFRTQPFNKDTGWSRPLPWLKTGYPYGVSYYNHAVSHIAQGPDGLLYVNSGSRTDGGEAGKDPRYATTGEEHLTSSIWRLNPDTESPEVEIFARGLRNTFGFCWDASGNLVGAENGPDAHAPEELNIIEQGHHYGFPYQFSDWKDKAYSYTPDVPVGLTFTLPLRNLGPDAGGGGKKGLFTFDPHSSPAGIIWLEPDWPAPLGGTFLVARFGNLLKLDADVGFDVLQIHPHLQDRTVNVNRMLSPLGRPIDVLKLSGHRIVIAEFTRGTSFTAGIGAPGRLLLLSPKN